MAERQFQVERRDLDDDRRVFGPATNFPFMDADKTIIQKDRRSRPERRVNNIIVEEISRITDTEFLKTGT